jgi:PiT family inorganic phosphate transporter
MLIVVVIVAGLVLAFANGANNNFKGVATLFGSGTADYRRALAWATATTFARRSHHVGDPLVVTIS